MFSTLLNLQTYNQAKFGISTYHKLIFLNFLHRKLFILFAYSCLRESKIQNMYRICKSKV